MRCTFSSPCHIHNIRPRLSFPLKPVIASLSLSLLLSLPLLLLPDIAPCPVPIYLPATRSIHPPASCPPRSASSSSKQVFGCQCLSVGGTDESVTLPVQLVMTITADCCISVGETISTLCSIDLSPHRSMSEHRVNTMRDGFSRKGDIFFFLAHLVDKMRQKVPFTYSLICTFKYKDNICLKKMTKPIHYLYYSNNPLINTRFLLYSSLDNNPKYPSLFMC